MKNRELVGLVYFFFCLFIAFVLIAISLQGIEYNGCQYVPEFYYSGIQNQCGCK